jgi:hypothetical protein
MAVVIFIVDFVFIGLTATICGWIIFSGIYCCLNMFKGTRGETSYQDDEPNGDNYVTMPNGDRRLD